MTKQQIKEDEVLHGYAQARKDLIEVQNHLAEAAEHCKGTALETALNDAWDQIEDLRFDLGIQYNAWAETLKEVAG